MNWYKFAQNYLSYFNVGHGGDEKCNYLWYFDNNQIIIKPVSEQWQHPGSFEFSGRIDDCSKTASIATNIPNPLLTNGIRFRSILQIIQNALTARFGELKFYTFNCNSDD